MRPICWLVVACLVPAGGARGDEPPPRCEVLTPRQDGIVAVGINARGDVLGLEWREDPKLPGVIGQEPFLARGGEMTRIPLLPTYTATFPTAVSDDGLVVGRCGKPGMQGRRVRMSNQAFTWTAADGIKPLASLPDDWASFAGGVSRDGNWIAGLSVGDDRMSPCVWERVIEDGRPTWRIAFLPQADRRHCSHVVAISGDGRRVVAVDGATPTMWTRAGAIRWTREALGPPGSISPRAVNDAGTVVGITSPPDGSTHAVTWTKVDGVKRIPEPEGYAQSEAAAINNAGAVVGMVDGPHGSPVGPRAFLFAGGKVRLLDEGGPNFTGAAAINDRNQVAGSFEAAEEDAPRPADPAKPADPKP